jgi:hypothetical protein
MLDKNCANYRQLNSRNSRLALIRVHPWLKKKLCGSLRPRRLCVEGVSVWLRLRRAVPLRCVSFLFFQRLTSGKLRAWRRR